MSSAPPICCAPSSSPSAAGSATRPPTVTRASRGLPRTPMSNNAAAAALPLTGTTVVLGGGGSISAYKAADLCSKLVQEGATVYPILTKGALRFVQPATFWGLAGQPISTDTFETPFGPEEIAHLRYAELADLFVI